MTHQEMRKAIEQYMINAPSAEQTDLVDHTIFVYKRVRSMENAKEVLTFRVGQKVTIDGRRSGSWNGVVEKINRTKLKIRHNETNVIWSVPPSMVKVEEDCSSGDMNTESLANVKPSKRDTKPVLKGKA